MAVKIVLGGWEDHGRFVWGVCTSRHHDLAAGRKPSSVCLTSLRKVGMSAPTVGAWLKCFEVLRQRDPHVIVYVFVKMVTFIFHL